MRFFFLYLFIVRIALKLITAYCTDIFGKQNWTCGLCLFLGRESLYYFFCKIRNKQNQNESKKKLIELTQKACSEQISFKLSEKLLHLQSYYTFYASCQKNIYIYTRAIIITILCYLAVIMRYEIKKKKNCISLKT